MLTVLRPALRTLPILRPFHSSCIQRNGLTNILGDVAPSPVQVQSFTADGLVELANGTRIPGGCIFLGGKVFLWDIPTSPWEEWSTDIFQIFEVVVPKPEILLMGTGMKTRQLPIKLRTYLHGMGIQTDVMDTKNACSTYNLLAEEGRNAAAALLPLTPLTWRRQ